MHEPEHPEQEEHSTLSDAETYHHHQHQSRTVAPKTMPSSTLQVGANFLLAELFLLLIEGV